ncbi:hypothetical protein Cgig2_010847 [Carnegiea gigantea]|uniref:UDP-N-acetylglucosamine--dolichyl-phosphate N-acetylglucosaminephosphotransferase n=1 Tax=Carnegiea gigantea TaxID=171969 RepID=A0A9Q1K6D9_9CARY|nr:hypothetical protein Cgig2_010847 [Carnegiea gigantea]
MLVPDNRSSPTPSIPVEPAISSAVVPSSHTKARLVEAWILRWGDGCHYLSFSNTQCYAIWSIQGSEYQQAHAFSIYLVQPFLAISLALFCYNWYPSSVFIGDTYTYFTGMTMAIVSILARRYIDHKVKLMVGISTKAYLQKLDKAIEVHSCSHHKNICAGAI